LAGKFNGGCLAPAGGPRNRTTIISREDRTTVQLEITASKHDSTTWSVTDDWPKDVPVTEAEVAVFEAWFGAPVQKTIKASWCSWQALQRPLPGRAMPLGLGAFSPTCTNCLGAGHDANTTQRPLPDDVLRIVMRGEEKEDKAAA
jgi:hypothetical protein